MLAPLKTVVLWSGEVSHVGAEVRPKRSSSLSGDYDDCISSSGKMFSGERD
jgi:hypothetical protein